MTEYIGYLLRECKTVFGIALITIRLYSILTGSSTKSSGRNVDRLYKWFPYYVSYKRRMDNN